MGQANFGIFEDFCGRATDGLSIFSKSLQKSVENLPARGEDKSPKICRCSRKNPHLSQHAKPHIFSMPPTPPASSFRPTTCLAQACVYSGPPCSKCWVFLIRSAAEWRRQTEEKQTLCDITTPKNMMSAPGSMAAQTKSFPDKRRSAFVDAAVCPEC